MLHSIGQGVLTHWQSQFLAVYQHIKKDINVRVVLMVKNLPANAGDTGGVGSIPWRRK